MSFLITRCTDTVSINTIEPGQLFQLAANIYMALESEEHANRDNVQAVRLSKGILVSFHYDTLVTPVNGELKIF